MTLPHCDWCRQTDGKVTPATTNLDGDNLCPGCADRWVRAEGNWQNYMDSEERAHNVAQQLTQVASKS